MINIKRKQYIIELFIFAIESKKKSAQLYLELSEVVKSEKLKKEFMNFFNDEKKHLNLMKQIELHKIIPATPPTALSISHKDYTDPNINPQRLSDTEIIILVLNHEKRFSMLFQKLSLIIKTQELKNLFKLIEKEAHKHEETIDFIETRT